MPRLTNEMINQRVKAAMSPIGQPSAERTKVSPQAFQSLLQRAQQRRGAAKPGLKISPEQRADLRAKALPTKRGEAERW